jgi:hypothetical protein
MNLRLPNKDVSSLSKRLVLDRFIKFNFSDMNKRPCFQRWPNLRFRLPQCRHCFAELTFFFSRMRMIHECSFMSLCSDSTESQRVQIVLNHSAHVSSSGQSIPQNVTF